MAISQTQLEAEIDAAKVAIDAGNWTTARSEIAKAQLTMSILPDHGIEGRYVRYRQVIVDLLKMVDTLEAKSADGNKNKRVFARIWRG